MPKKSAVVIKQLRIEGDANQPRLNIEKLNVEAGRVTALIGSSGSGKSTLIKACLGLEKIHSGSIEVNGKSTATNSAKKLRSLRSTVGYVQQSANLIERITALENVLIGSLALLKLPRIGIASYPAWAKSRAATLMEQFGIKSLQNHLANSISGGQKQRVAIARALMHEPEIILADEPISALDAINSKQTMELLAGLAKNQEITILVALHQIDMALKYSDNLVVLSRGKVVYQGKTSAMSKAKLIPLLKN